MSFAVALLALAVAVLVAGGLVLVWVRARAARRQLAIDLHDRSLALDLRADALAARAEALELGLRQVHLDRQIEVARRRGLLSAAAAGRLADLALDWQAEGAAAGRV